MSNFSFSHSVFKRFVSQGHQKVSLCGNWLKQLREKTSELEGCAGTTHQARMTLMFDPTLMTTIQVKLGTLTYQTLMRRGNNIHVQQRKTNMINEEWTKTQIDAPFFRLLPHACRHLCSAR